ncbi:MAG: hypothetical protein HC887_05310 [Desulfobacteraceae bacterium]|nr:hypothetical protein [Desulfobacteraceae bacterium]
MKLKQTSIAFSCIALFILIANALFIGRIYHSHGLVKNAQRHRQDALMLVYDLRLQTHQLSRLVQTYTTTAEPRYLMYYYDILYIRQGKKPLPAEYDPTYWDRVISGEISHQIPESGNPQPLSAQMRSMGFGREEMESLQNISDITESMKQIEQIAFAATQGLYDPENRSLLTMANPIWYLQRIWFMEKNTTNSMLLCQSR